MSFYDIQHWVNKGMSEKEAIEKVKDIKERTNRYCVEFWLRKGLTENEAKQKISEIQKLNNSKVDQKNKPNPTRLDYWLNKGYSLEESKEKQKERQSTFSLKKCIHKYGEIEGLKIFEDRQKKWQKTLNENNDKEELNKKRGLNKDKFINKHGIERYSELCKIKSKASSKEGLIENIGLEKYIERINNIKISIKNSGFNRYSKISMELFTDIEEMLDDKCYYGKNEKIIQFYDSSNKYFCFYVDFTYKNKIIEFYGDYYHANPKIYEKDKIVGSKYSCHKAEDIWKIDLDRIKLIKEKGFDVLIVWESDYKNNKEKIKNKCIKWIKNL